MQATFAWGGAMINWELLEHSMKAAFSQGIRLFPRPRSARCSGPAGSQERTILMEAALPHHHHGLRGLQVAARSTSDDRVKAVHQQA